MDSEQDNTGEHATDLMETGPASAGDTLRAARESKRLDLEHIAAETRIPVRHLESIETGAFDALPSRTYAIGFSKTYARAVGLDPAEIVDKVREELADGQARATAMAGGMEPGDPAKLPTAGLAWFGAIAAVILAVGVIVFYNTYFGAGTGPASLVEDNATEQAVQATGDAADAERAASDAPSADDPVVLTATGDGAWVRFYEDGGEILYEGVMEAGDTFEVPEGAVDPRLNTGRPNFLEITIGGAPVAPISEEMVPVADARVSAEALLARGEGESEVADDAESAAPGGQ
ncbi:helix-turn-helix domain-containing protein [Qipengyuania nanhaisediminis]|uniref:helix-turn-helix domain-containing protein n=1 Tax=Qipengyuania nanhaisediminis TaxID=604088 RepID=UPI0038B3F221